jgi:hypothetical protein
LTPTIYLRHLYHTTATTTATTVSDPNHSIERNSKNNIMQAASKTFSPKPRNNMVRISPKMSAAVNNWEMEPLTLGGETKIYERGTLGYVTQNRKLFIYDDYIDAIKLKEDGYDLECQTDMKPRSFLAANCIVS